MFRQHTPDVTLMDLRMPEMNGVETITALRQEFPGSCFIVLTTFDGDEDIYRALEAGAVGYLLKDVFREDLLEAIRAVHAPRCCQPTGKGRSLPCQASLRVLPNAAAPL
jgi:DNA-binding NarL/FixJ family response regulator